LVELTRFGKKILEINEAEVILNEFIGNNFGAFEIMEKERGVIPMDPDFPPLEKKSNWINIGTRAGNVKPSTGYAFKNMYNQSRFLCRSDGFQIKRNLRKRRFHFYDQLLLIILTVWPEKGRLVFERLFKVQNTAFVLQFLDEKSKPSQEFKMFFNLQISLFLKAVLLWVNWKLKPYVISILMILTVLIPSESGFSGELDISRFQVIILMIGLLLIGIPHGALDHFTNAIDQEKRVTFKFVIRYLSLMAIIFLVWVWSPLFALVLFLIYSAWHFGQTDTKQWKVNSRIVGFLWGMILLSSLFITHLKEFNIILSALDVPLVPSLPKMMSWTYLIMGLGFTLSVFYRKLEWLLLICFLFFAQFTNLIFAFGIYFIFHHSRLGWLHLKKKLKVSHVKMYTRALPFNVGAILLFILFFSNVELSLKENIAYFFIFLSCVSFPHVLCMDVFYGESD
jgi:Brp/Blh family beta-carotene 15,15'-monooxygenase